MVRPAGSFSSQEAPSTIGISTAISAIMVSEMPSTPRREVDAEDGIQSTEKVSRNGTSSCRRRVARRRAVGDPQRDDDGQFGQREHQRDQLDRLRPARRTSRPAPARRPPAATDQESTQVARMFMRDLTNSSMQRRRPGCRRTSTGRRTGRTRSASAAIGRTARRARRPVPLTGTVDALGVGVDRAPGSARCPGRANSVSLIALPPTSARASATTAGTGIGGGDRHRPAADEPVGDERHRSPPRPAWRW